jgi:hypothetical protein
MTDALFLTEEQRSLMKDIRQSWKTAIMEDGATCPCCARFGRAYSRSINKSMALTLRWLYDYAKSHGLGVWADIQNDGTRVAHDSREHSRMAFWQLVEKKPIDRENKSGGFYRITQKGIDFVEGRIVVPKNLFIHNVELLGASEEMTNFESCLEERFSYHALTEPKPLMNLETLFDD